MGNLRLNETEIRKTVSVMKAPGQIFEVRVILDEKTNYSGYFKDADTLIAQLHSVPVAEGNVYLLLNQLKEDCWSRKQANKFIRNVKDATKDSDIVGYEWLLIDLDPERTKGISSTDDEIELGYQKAREVFSFLKSYGFEDPILGFSGNGYHLLYRVAIDVSVKDDIKKFLNVLDALFSTGALKIDTVNYNPARVCKLYGTLAMKGRDDPEGGRPHRMSEIVYLPEEIKATKIQYLRAVNAIMPDEPEVKHYNSYNPKEFDLDEWLRKYGIGFQKVQAGSATKYILDKCPFDDNHKGKDACLFVSANGAIGFHCFHNSCADKKWQDVRKLYEPDAYEEKQKYTDDALYGHFNTGKVKHTEPIPEGGAAFLNAMDILNIEEPEEEFIPTGIYWIDKKMRGLKKTGVSVVSGSRGASKSTLLTQLCANVVDAGYKVAMYSGEMKNKNLLRWMNLQIAGKACIEATQYDNYFVVSKENQRIIAEWLGDNFWLYDNQYGNDCARVIDQLEQVIQDKQIDLIVMDNLMALDINNLGRDKWESQKEFVWQLHELAIRSNTHIIFVAHPRKPNGFLRLDDISGTADIANAVDNAFIVHRVNEDFKRLSGLYLSGKTKEVIFDATNCIEIAKDRDGGNQDVFIPLYYEKETKRLRNDKSEYKVYKCELIQEDPF